MYYMNVVVLLYIMYTHFINTVLLIILNKEIPVFGIGWMRSKFFLGGGVQ